jgi:hypothetical protein
MRSTGLQGYRSTRGVQEENRWTGVVQYYMDPGVVQGYRGTGIVQIQGTGVVHVC